MPITNYLHIATVVDGNDEDVKKLLDLLRSQPPIMHGYKPIVEDEEGISFPVFSNHPPEDDVDGGHACGIGVYHPYGGMELLNPLIKSGKVVLEYAGTYG